LPKIEVLEMSNISKSFHTTRANHRVNLRIQAGEILGLLGENGAGKTTLMNILYGLIPVDEGVIRINGQAVRIESPRASGWSTSISCLFTTIPLRKISPWD
jgi:simple sugar transport system ATP-binding protein